MNDGQLLVIFEPLSKRVLVPRGTTILDASNEAGGLIKAYCGGQGTCGKCKVQFKGSSSDESDALSPLTLIEEKMLSKEEMDGGYRLACQARLETGARIFIPVESRRMRHKILEQSLLEDIDLLPSAMRVKIALDKRVMTRYRSILSAIHAKCQEKLHSAGYLGEKVKVYWESGDLVGIH